jgi:4-oxalocrotonate tautomerase
VPLVNIDLLEGRTAEEVRMIADSVHDTMAELLDVPRRDRFQIVTEHGPGTFNFDRHYLDIERSDRFVLVRITLSAGRSADAKRAFYRRLADLLADRAHLRSEDLAVMMVENHREDWSFGNGQASYLELSPEAWQ